MHQGHTVQGPVADSATHPTYLDIDLAPEGAWELAVNREQTVLVLVFSGSTTELSAGQMGVYRQGDTLALKAATQGARALLLAGTPIGEPVVQHGPFVMNTREEIEQAIVDYNEGRLVA